MIRVAASLDDTARPPTNKTSSQECPDLHFLLQPDPYFLGKMWRRLFLGHIFRALPDSNLSYKPTLLPRAQLIFPVFLNFSMLR